MLTKVCIVKVVFFPVVMYGNERWTINKADHWRIDAFKLWCWRRLLRVPWTSRRSGQLILKEIKPEYSLEELLLKLKLQYFGDLVRRANSLEKTDAGKDWRKKEKEVQRIRWLDSISNSIEMNLSKFQEIMEDREAWHAEVHGSQRIGHNLVTEQQQQ